MRERVDLALTRQLRRDAKHVRGLTTKSGDARLFSNRKPAIPILFLFLFLGGIRLMCLNRDVGSSASVSDEELDRVFVLRYAIGNYVLHAYHWPNRHESANR